MSSYGRHQRKSPRLPGYDYAQSGAYFVTICTQLRQHHFGDIQNQAMIFSPMGSIVQAEIAQIPQRWQQVDLDGFVVMPNHVHAIIVLIHPSGMDTQKPPTLGRIVGNFKAGVTRLAVAQGLLDAGDPLWQERYHDHIIRDERRYHIIRQYIQENPARWEEDRFFKPE